MGEKETGHLSSSDVDHPLGEEKKPSGTRSKEGQQEHSKLFKQNRSW